MRTPWIGAVTLFSLLLASPLAAQSARELRGQIFHLGENGEKIFDPGLIVTLVETGATDDANDQGIFRLPLPPAFQPGDSVTISIDKPGWRIRFPLDGEARIPRNLLREVVPIELLQVGSKLFWTNDRIEKFIRDTSERSKQERRREGEAPSLDLGREIKDWAAKYGFSSEEARQEIDRWIADVDAAHEDNYQKGLAAFAKQQFDTAAERFRDSAEWRIRQLDETRKQQEKLAEKAERLQEEVVRDLRLQGDSHYYACHYQQALTVYEQAHQYTSKDQTPQLWGATLNDIGRAHLQLGIRVAAAEITAHLAAAVQAHRQALLVFTIDKWPQDWAKTQGNLGEVMSFQAMYTADKEGAELLGEAIQAYRQALLVYNREQWPKIWAVMQGRLGDALLILGGRLAGEESGQMIAQAIEVYRQILFVLTREQLPQGWAAAQTSLGHAFEELGMRKSGAEGTQLIGEAVQAYRLALLVYTREQLPQGWASAQLSLGGALREQGIRKSGADGAQLLEEAVQSYRQALLVYTREQLPQAWASIQNGLGTALQEQGTRKPDAEDTQLLEEAVQSYHQALLVYTREQMPTYWAFIQGNLGTALTELGKRTSGDGGGQFFEQAVEAYRQALLVITRDQLPLQWATAQASLCNTLQEQGKRASGEAGTQFFAQALDTCRQALLILTPEHFSQQWAEARSYEVKALLALHRYKEAADSLSQVLAKELDVNRRIDALGYAIAAGVAMDSAEVPNRIEELLGLAAAQPQDFSISWVFEGTLHWLEEDPEVPRKGLLIRLFKSLEATDRDSLIAGLRDLREALPIRRNP